MLWNSVPVCGIKLLHCSLKKRFILLNNVNAAAKNYIATINITKGYHKHTMSFKVKFPKSDFFAASMLLMLWSAGFVHYSNILFLIKFGQILTYHYLLTLTCNINHIGVYSTIIALLKQITWESACFSLQVFLLCWLRYSLFLG